MPERLAVAQVTPYAWESGHEVDVAVRRLAAELAGRGHRTLIVAPTTSQGLVRDSRRLVRAAHERPESLLEAAQDGPLVLGAGEVLPVPSAPRRSSRPLPIDVARTVEEVLTVAPLDVVHVHEPFAPSVASAALRHSRALNVGSFHAPTERVVSTQLARRVVELVLGRLDARTASFGATAELMRRFFPADYRVVLPGCDADPPTPPRESWMQTDGAPVRIAYVAREERPALRLFLRALRRLPLEPAWRATVIGAPTATLRSSLRERVRFVPAGAGREAEVLAASDLVVLASGGELPAPGAALRAMAAGAIPLAARLPAYDELAGEGDRGLLFEPGDVETLVAQLGRLVADPFLRARLAEAAVPFRARLTWQRAADEFEDVYGGLVARRHADRTPSPVRRRLRERPLIDVDLHMHTDHSSDCATPVEVLLATAKARGLGAIAVTDHNEIAGAHEAALKANGIKVIVGEEVKTASQGEVIGLFIEDKIPRGMTLAETIAEIRRQGGLVYVPHPFDRMHAVPDYEHLLGVVEDIDAIEVYNPRVAIGSFNEEAVRFAAKYRIPAGAGSDAHVAQGLGSVRMRMRDFDGPEEFLASLRDADIVRTPASLLYVQALKFIETKATPAPARRARRDRRVRRAARKS